MSPWLLHPAVVHFPIALLTLGGALAAGRALGRGPAWLAAAESWLAWLGAAAAWAALGAGLLAENTAPHLPLAWETLHEHEELGWWTVGVFTMLALLKLWGEKLVDGRRLRAAELVLWAAGLGVLYATAWHGGELVFGYGMGVTGR